MVGTRLGPYELLEELGSGGMATVYRAYQPSMERYVAVKVIHHTVANDAGLERFQREARLIARLEHPHILPIYDYNGSHDPPYIVMRYLPGGTWRDVLKRQPEDSAALSFNDILHWLKQVASALDYAHRHSIVHRDLKPSNIMVDEEGNAFLTDFGVARLMSLVGQIELTQSGTTMGTPSYMAPEQAMGAEDVGPPADLYSLGVMLFESLTGRLPFESEVPVTMMLKHLQEPAPNATRFNPALPLEVDAVLLRAMAKRPQERYASATEFAAALVAALKLPTSPTAVTAPLPALSAREKQALKPTEAAPVVAPPPLRTAPQQNKQVTVLHADLAEFERTLYDVTDADLTALRDTMAQLWARIERALVGHGGSIMRRTARTLTVVWGADVAREDDPERAVHTALALREATRLFTQDGAQPLQIGLATGPVALVTSRGPKYLAVESETAEFTAFGPAISAAGRLTAALPEGGIAITHALYRLVRGVFDVEALPTFRMRGHKTPLEIYRVKAAKPRTFRAPTRGVEGIETQLVGREGEFRQLQTALETASEAEAQFVLLVGDTGVGKSRLIDDLEKYVDVGDIRVRLFKGRATPEMAAQPYALLRDLFMFRFEIQDNDSPATVQLKLEQHVARWLDSNDTATAHFIGQLLGFDFSRSPHLQKALQDASEFHAQALRQLTYFFRAATQTATPTGGETSETTIWLVVEDLHWADEKSLEALVRLARENADTRLLIVGAARPSFSIETFRRHLAESLQRNLAIIELRPLSKRDSRRLVKEILQKVPDLPHELRDLIVERAEGNPLYIEELIKALIEDRVILPGAEQWKVEVERLRSTSVPPTLVGVLQARLDSLTPDERTVLQRAAVLGRVFWDRAVVALETGDSLPIDTPNILRALQRKGLIYPSESSAFAGAQEYTFASNLLCDVTYASAYQRQQQAYHAAAAHWLVEASGDSGRSLERASVIAEHYERAGAGEQAAKYLSNAAAQAIRLNAYEDAKAFLDRALPYTVEGTLQRAAVLQQLGRINSDLGHYHPAEQHYQEALNIYEACGEPAGVAASALGLATSVILQGDNERGEVHLHTSLAHYRSLNNPTGIADGLLQLAAIKRAKGDYEAEEACLHECLPLYRKLNNRQGIGLTLTGLSILARTKGHYVEARRLLEEGLTIYRDLGNQREMAFVLNNLGYLAGLQEDHITAERFLHESVALAREIGNRWVLGSALNQLGYAYCFRNDFDTAAEVLEESLGLCREINDQWGVAVCLVGLGRVALGRQQDPVARQHFLEGLQTALRAPVLQVALEALLGLATLAAQSNQPMQALEWLGLILHHCATRHETRSEAQELILRLQTQVPTAAVQPTLELGQHRTLETIATQLLAGS